LRTPVRKAMLAAAVTPATYGRAFGFERMMDTCGAIVGPATAFLLFRALGHSYPRLFFWTLVPGLAAVACVAFLVHENHRTQVSSISFREGLRRLPARYRRFLVAVGIFGAGDFAHTLLILLAAQRLLPSMGAAGAAGAAIGLYVAHNVFYAGFAFIAGLLADRASKPRLLAGGYGLGAAMAFGIMVLPLGFWTLALVFVLGGIYVAIEETLEDSLCAELVAEDQHGMAFGVLATVNGAGDFLSSIIVGALWSAFGTTVAFGYSLLLFTVGAALILRIAVPARPDQTHC
jgi:MFS-type transporter involved in bile tolerance (Atg22 family)